MLHSQFQRNAPGRRPAALECKSARADVLRVFDVVPVNTLHCRPCGLFLDQLDERVATADAGEVQGDDDVALSGARLLPGYWPNGHRQGRPAERGLAQDVRLLPESGCGCCADARKPWGVRGRTSSAGAEVGSSDGACGGFIRGPGCGRGLV